MVTRKQNVENNQKDINGIIGQKLFYKDGIWKIIYYNRIEYIDKNGLLHRNDDDPAITYNDGHEAWYIHGIKHRIGNYAEIRPNGNKFWFKYGILHNSNGPAVINYNINTVFPKYEYWLNGKQFLNIKTNEEWMIKQIIE